MTDSLQTALDRPYGQTPEAHAAAIARVSREPDAVELLAMLGLVADPIVEERNRAKAAAELRKKSVPPRAPRAVDARDPAPRPPPSKPRAGYCPLCNNRMTRDVCRRSARCREAARDAGGAR